MTEWTDIRMTPQQQAENRITELEEHLDVLTTVLAEMRMFLSQRSEQYRRDAMDAGNHSKVKWVATGRKEGMEIALSKLNRTMTGLWEGPHNAA